MPNKPRLVQFLLGFILSSLLAVLYYLYTTYLLDAQIEKNQQYSFLNFIMSLGWTLRSVLYEELLFRGVLLYLMMQFLGSRWAVVLSSIAFGIMHWFSYSVFGDLQAMISVFLLTFTAGVVFSYAFITTGSMYYQTALHFGWNLVSVVIFSQGPLGDQFFKVSAPSPNATQSLIFFLIQLILIPGIMFLSIRILRKKRLAATQERHQLAG